MLKSFIGADMRLYERFGVGLHNNPDVEVFILKKFSNHAALRDLKWSLLPHFYPTFSKNSA